jgi:hypothetical protein
MPKPDILEKLSQEFKVFAANLESDPHISEVMRNELLTVIEIQPQTEWRACIESYCRSNKLSGPVCTLRSKELLGRVHSMEALTQQISEQMNISREMAHDFLLSVITDPDFGATLLQQASNVPLSAWLIWSFRNGSAAKDPFRGINIADLLCILGVDSNVLGRCVYFAHSLPTSITAYRPTVFDAELNQYWRPGGFTIPLETCSHQYSSGMEEVVHNPIRFSSIKTAIWELTI